MSTIKELIQDAVGEAVKRLGGLFEESERKRLLEEAEEEFKQRLMHLRPKKLALKNRLKTCKDNSNVLKKCWRKNATKLLRLINLPCLKKAWKTYGWSL